ELERWVLHRLAELDRVVRRAVEDFDFHAMFTALHGFCAVDLSAFYFDIRKDRLYCDAPGDPMRRATPPGLDPPLRRPLPPLPRPDPLLPPGGGWARPPRRSAGPQHPSRNLRRGAGGMARCCARRALGRPARPAPGSDRRARTRTRCQTHRVEPAGSARPLC